MARGSLDFSEQSFLGATGIVIGIVGSVVTVASLFQKDPTTLIAIAAGAAWALSICLFVLNGLHRRRISELLKEADEVKTELATARRQADHWAETAKNVSFSTTTILQMMPAAPVPPRRRTARQDEGAGQ